MFAIRAVPKGPANPNPTSVQKSSQKQILFRNRMKHEPTWVRGPLRYMGGGSWYPFWSAFKGTPISVWSPVGNLFGNSFSGRPSKGKGFGTTEPRSLWVVLQSVQNRALHWHPPIWSANPTFMKSASSVKSIGKELVNTLN